jgi:hypothetical protein
MGEEYVKLDGWMAGWLEAGGWRLETGDWGLGVEKAIPTLPPAPSRCIGIYPSVNNPAVTSVRIFTGLRAQRSRFPPRHQQL